MLHKIAICIATVLALNATARAQPGFWTPIAPLVTGNQYAPFVDRHLPGGGLIAEIVTAAFGAVGREAHVVYLPWQRAFAGVARGQYAGTFPHFHSQELAEDFYYSDPIYPLVQRIYISQDRGLDFHTLDDLTGHRMCSPIGHVLDQSLQKLVDTAAISIISPASIEVCARMLERGRVDFMALDETVYRRLQYNTGRDWHLQPVGKPLSSSELYVLFPKSAPDSLMVLWEFNRGLQMIHECGAFNRLVERHLDMPVDSQ